MSVGHIDGESVPVGVHSAKVIRSLSPTKKKNSRDAILPGPKTAAEVRSRPAFRLTNQTSLRGKNSHLAPSHSLINRRFPWSVATRNYHWNVMPTPVFASNIRDPSAPRDPSCMYLRLTVRDRYARTRVTFSNEAKVTSGHTESGNAARARLYPVPAAQSLSPRRARAFTFAASWRCIFVYPRTHILLETVQLCGNHCPFPLLLQGKVYLKGSVLLVAVPTEQDKFMSCVLLKCI